MRYVVGFMFDEKDEVVLLVRKKRPEWMSGKWNGIGGKIEGEEDPLHAMHREFLEETGISSYLVNWNLFCHLVTTLGEEVWFFYCRSAKVGSANRDHDEEVKLHLVADLPKYVLPNLRWLIPMALSFRRGEKCRTFRVEEIR